MRRHSTTWLIGVMATALLMGLTLAACPGDMGGMEAAPQAEQQTEQSAQAASTAWIYQDQLASPWVDATWAKVHSLSNTNPVATGQYSISVTMGPWEGLYFAHPTVVPVATGDTLVLKVHGGTNSNNVALRVRAIIGASQPVGVPLGPTCDGGAVQAGKWVSCRVPMSQLIPAGRTSFTGIWIQEDSGKTLAPLYFDDIGVEQAAAPVQVTVSPTSATLAPGATQAFTATVTGSPNTAVTWSVDPAQNGGTVTAQGVYTAPATAGTYRVVAQSQADPSKQAIATIVVTPPTATGKWVSGYYTGWNADDYPPEKVDFSAITHILVGRAVPKADGTLSTQFDNDQGPQIARTLSQRAHAAGRKAIIMVGGSGEHDGWVGAASNANRTKFVTNLLKAMDDFGYDGLDLDWEPVDVADRPNLLALVKALRQARPNMLLTFPIHWININFPEDADPWYAQLAPYLDQVNVMSYEMIGPWDGWQSWFTSALKGETGVHPTSVASSLALWVQAGIPKAKLGMGIPFYGLAWRHITGPYQPFTDWSDYVGGDNSFTYKKITGYAPKGTYHWDDTAQADYLTFAPPNLPEDGTVTWISYDGPRAIAAKGAFAKAQGYGGTIIWTVNQGCTNPTTGANPLLDAVKAAFLQ
ncbi:glycosyl hydrolase family 18 protein [Corallococcus silvisoli]|uniref:glycosyl hydrolase family 18 protein n=1 Tax=Corallococcus silvisoli TaxID=2697031 RepID=UPI00137785B5|nr:glycosyl hydrolase family 18 protein [Corallococcus silvisoli]NBD08723.1 chitinase [Corallococcus silvisoli]